ncbi:MAG: (4Fe-4S)-binding protein [Lachnospiraceae bacterium]|nr:(4Fe-4S)-binding protein [Lachnospiraceae bacterium]
MHRLYNNEDISVFWDSDRCFHAKRCVTGCPEAFDKDRRPWIDIDRAPTAKVWQAVTACPSGALTVTYNHDVSVAFDEEGSRSVAYIGNEKIGECDFEASADGWNIYHTEVDASHTGLGIAKRLVYAILQEGERRKLKVSATCSYALSVLSTSDK